MKKIFSLLIAVLVSASLFAVPVNNNAAATVNLIRNRIITNAQLAAQMQEAGASEEQALEVLNVMINDEVFLQGAERDGITISDAQRNSLYSQQRLSYEQQVGTTVTEAQWESIVTQAYGSVDAYKTALGNQYILQTYLMQERGEALRSRDYTPSQSEVETFYRRNATSFSQAENVLFSHIYMAKTGDSAQDANKLSTMQGVASRIKNGSLTFEAAVSQYSEDTSSNTTGGVMGWLASDNTSVRTLWGDSFVDTVLSLPLGQASDVIESNVGYHIVRVSVHNDARILLLDDRIQPDVDYTVRDYITEMLANQNMQVAMADELNDMIEKLRSEARIRVIYTP